MEELRVKITDCSCNDLLKIAKKCGFVDGLGKWVYEGRGRVEDNGWEDEESISLNGVQMYKLRGTGHSFIQGF